MQYLARPRPEDQVEAERLFQKALRTDPDRPDAHAGLARVSTYLYTLGIDETEARLSTALRESRRAVELAPQDAGAAVALAYALAAGDRLTPALQEAKRAVAADPTLAEAHVALCVVLRLRRDDQGALDVCRRAAEIAPDDPRVLSALGEALRETRRYSEALEMFGQAIDLDHESIVPQLATGATLLKGGNLPVAQRLYSVLLRDWDYALGRVRLGVASLRVLQHDYPGALQTYESLEVPSGSAMPALLILYGKGYCLTRMGRDPEAEYFLSSIIERVPEDYDGPARGRELLFNAYDDLVTYFQSKGRDRKVMTLLRSACARPLAPTRLARSLTERLEGRQESAEAAAALEKAILNADPLEDPVELADSTLKLVRLRTSNGTRRLQEDTPAARALAHAADQVKSSDLGAVHYRLARAWSLAQRSEAAVQSLLRARASGYLPTDQLAGEPDFEQIRHDPGFETLLQPQTP